MPLKHMQDFFPTLCVQYPDGHYAPIGEISDINVEPADYSQQLYNVDSGYPDRYSMQSEMTIYFKWDADAKTEYLLVYGKMPSNNWLKIHGYQMQRKRKIRKLRKPRKPR